MPSTTFDLARLVANGQRTPSGGPPSDEGEASARAALVDLARSAQVFAVQHESLVGFADALTREQGPAIARQMALLTDTSAVARLDSGRCLSVDFVTGQITDSRC